MALAKEVGHCIRALRRQRGLTQAALAELIDRSEVALRAIERGASAPSFETLERLTLALDISAAGLFPVVRPGDGTRHGDTERRAREVAAIAAIARQFDDSDLALAVALVKAVAKAAPERLASKRQNNDSWSFVSQRQCGEDQEAFLAESRRR